MNKKFQTSKNKNPALRQMQIEKRVKEAMNTSRDSGLEYGKIISMLSFTMLLDKSSLKDDEKKQIIKDVNLSLASVDSSFVSINEVIHNFKERLNLDISDERLIELCPVLEGYLDSSTSKQ